MPPDVEQHAAGCCTGPEVGAIRTGEQLDRVDRIALIAVDYPSRRRLKLLGHAVWNPDPDPGLRTTLGLTGQVEGLVTVEVAAFDWNCPKLITPRYTAEQVRELTGRLTARIADLEAQPAGARFLIRCPGGRS